MVYLLWQLTRDIGSTVGLDVFGFGVTDLILTLILRSIVGASLLRAAFRRRGHHRHHKSHPATPDANPSTPLVSHRALIAAETKNL